MFTIENAQLMLKDKYVHGNKIAGKRARKASIKIEKLLLDYRLESLNRI